MSCQTLNMNQNPMNCMTRVKDCMHKSHRSPTVNYLSDSLLQKLVHLVIRIFFFFFYRFQNGAKYSFVLSKQVRTHLACLQRQMKRNQMCPKTSGIRAQADVINLLVSGKRSGWTQNCWSTIGWLIINCGWNRSVPVLTTQGWRIQIDFISNSIPPSIPYSPILLWCFDINCRPLKHKI